MKKLFLLLAFCSSAFAEPVSFNLNGIGIPQALSVAYADIMKKDFSLHPDLVADPRLVNFRFTGDSSELRSFLSSFLEGYGYAVFSRSGADFIQPLPPKEKPELELVSYRPIFRDAAYLRSVVSSVFGLSAASSLPSPASTPAQSSNGPSSPVLMPPNDVLVFRLPSKDAALLRSLLPSLDVDSGQLAIRAVIYEVQSSKSDGSALQLMASVLGSRLGVNIGGSTLSNNLTLKVGGIEAVLSALATDSRFNAVTQPRLRVRSGEVSKLTVGQDVPVIGAVSFQQNGSSVRSVEYKSSGTILSVKPTIRGDFVQLEVHQQLSNFVRTDTGVDDSPTLIKRDLQTTISINPGEVVVLGGLTESKNSAAERGFSFLPWSTSKSAAVNNTDVLIVLQADAI